MDSHSQQPEFKKLRTDDLRSDEEHVQNVNFSDGEASSGEHDKLDIDPDDKLDIDPEDKEHVQNVNLSDAEPDDDARSILSALGAIAPDDGPSAIADGRSAIEDDLYKIMGVPATASSEDIRTAFHRKAEEGAYRHPDKGGSAEMFHKLNLAYQILIDKERRDLYDTQGITEPTWTPEKMVVIAQRMQKSFLTFCGQGAKICKLKKVAAEEVEQGRTIEVTTSPQRLIDGKMVPTSTSHKIDLSSIGLPPRSGEKTFVKIAGGGHDHEDPLKRAGDFFLAIKVK